MTRAGRWRVERVLGSAAEVHAREVTAATGPAVWVVEAAAPALVLGSAQPASDVDEEAAGRLGLPVVRRRSGGGAVYVHPEQLVWIDVIVPRDDPRWDDDVGRSGAWLGAVWAGALADVGVAASVHSGPMTPDPLARHVCFVGRAAPELTVAGQKVVGVAQRRTREGARFQAAAVLRWDPEPLIAVLAPALGPGDADRVRQAAVGIGRPAGDVVEAFLGRLAIR